MNGGENKRPKNKRWNPGDHTRNETRRAESVMSINATSEREKTGDFITGRMRSHFFLPNFFLSHKINKKCATGVS